MNNPIVTLVIAITATLAANLIQRFIDRPHVQESAKKLSTKIATKGSKKVPTWLQIVLSLFVFWFLIDQLMALVTSTSPLTRGDALMISFWTCWLIVYFVQTVLRRIG